jgi:NAD(P)-dependent dehydrogenase (short-subunit alcohol dehydrogenase family)
MIIITGASKGIGKYLCDEYSKQNFDIYGIYNSTFTESSDFKTKFSKLNTTNYNEIVDWFEEVKPYLKDITLINCAGINYNSFAHKAEASKWKEVIDVNLIGTFNMINVLLPLMREQSFGRIINFGSVVAELPSPGISAYAASKSALYGMAKSIAVENATKGITINNINLGYSELGMISEVPEKFLEDIKKRIPSNKLCKPSDILNTVDYLRNTEYVNGTEININGGII